jgi:hypothetical protein
MNSEQAEAQRIDQEVETWCKTWKVDVSKLTKTYVLNDKGQLCLELVAPLHVPITSVKTRLIITVPEPATGSGTGADSTEPS